MRKTLLSKTFAVIAALFALMCMLPQKAMAADYGTVTIDGTKKTIQSYACVGVSGFSGDNDYCIFLYLNSGKTEYVQIYGDYKTHVKDSDWTDLTKIETKVDGVCGWSIVYSSGGNTKFSVLGTSTTFTAGNMQIYGDPRATGGGKCGVLISGGKLKYNNVSWTLDVNFKWESTPPTVGSFTIAENKTGCSLKLNWTKATDTQTPEANMHYRVDYKIASNTGWTIKPILSNSTSYEIKGLTTGQTYIVEVLAVDMAGNYKSYGTQTVTVKDTEAPKFTPNFKATNITEKGFTISWDKATDTNTPQSKLRYELCYRVAGTTTIWTSCGLGINNLSATPSSVKPNTNYEFYVEVRDEAGNKTRSGIGTCSTLADTKKPTIPSPQGIIYTVNQTTGKSCAIQWNPATDNATAQDKLQYRVLYGLKSSTSWDYITKWQTATTYTINDLSDGKEYEFMIQVKDEAEITSNYTRTTFKTPDKTAPKVNNNTISLVSSTETTLKISWVAPEENVTSASNLVYRVYCHTSTSGLVNYKVGEVKGQTTYTITGLQPNTKYYVDIKAVDEAGNSNFYHPLGGTEPDFTTKEDKTAPTPPSAQPTATVTKNSATIKWNPASDNVTAASNLQYKILWTYYNGNWSDGGETDWFTGTTYTINGLNDSQKYAYVLRIKDEAGNIARYNNNGGSFFFTTLDATAPTVAQNDISHEGSTDSSIKISWKAATDNATSADNLVYRIYCNTSTANFHNYQVGEVKGKTEFTITGLQPDTKYYVDIRVVDEAGNGKWYHPTAGTEPSFRTNVKTAIEGVEMDETTEHDAIYDLRGVKQNQSWDALPKGIYIINGKKHVKK